MYIAGTLRLPGKQSSLGSEGEQAGGLGRTAWQAPPIVFRGADDTEAPSTPTRVRQFLKRGVVKFKEVSLLTALSDVADAWHQIGFSMLEGSYICCRLIQQYANGVCDCSKFSCGVPISAKPKQTD